MNLPNTLTLFRIALIPVFISFLLVSPEAQPHARFIALAIFLTASISDALDGFIARFWNQQTEMGAFLDPIADKLLILSGLLGLLWTEQGVYRPANWIMVVVLFREVVLVVGFCIFFFLSRKVVIRPNLLGKTTTVAQMFLIIGCLLNLSILAQPVAWMTVMLTIASGCVYVVRELKNVS